MSINHWRVPPIWSKPASSAVVTFLEAESFPIFNNLWLELSGRESNELEAGRGSNEVEAGREINEAAAGCM
jgi:hypothetical protein